MNPVACDIRVRGMIQGVGFRYDTRRNAQGLGLRGWVRNEEDGTVRIHAEGLVHAIQQLVDWCRKGNHAGRFTSIETNWHASSEHLMQFDIRF